MYGNNEQLEAVALAEAALEAHVQAVQAVPSDLLQQQVGGTHYTGMGLQPWEYISRNDLDFFQGNVIKYVSRWKDKGGVQDLYKAQHTLQFYIRWQEQQHANNS